MNNTFSIQPGSEEPQEQEIHLRDYLSIITKHKTTVITFFIIVFLIVLIKTYTTTPLYTASSQVLIERNFGDSALDSSPYARWDPDFLATQFELIKSPNVTRRVVSTLKLDTKYKHYFLKEKKEGLFSFISTAKTGLKDFIKGLLPAQETDPESLASDNNLLVSAEPVTDADRIASMIRANLSIKPVTNTKTVVISFSHKNPAMAKLVMDSIVKAYTDEILEIKLASSSYSLQWMTSKADEERKRLEKSELALQQYMRDNDLVTVENKLAVYPQRLSEFSSQLSKAQGTLKELEALHNQIQKLGNDYKNIETISVFAKNPVLQSLREKIFAVEQKIKDLSKKYGYKHPVMINAKAERDLLLKEKDFEINRIIDATRNAYELAESKVASLKQLLASTKQEILNINERFTQYSIMKREVDMNRVLYDALTSSINKAGVTKQSQDVKIWVVREAQLPTAPSKPNKKRNLALGVILGLFGGIGVAFFIEYLDNNVKDGKDIEQRFDITVLGTVEELKAPDESIETHLVKHPLSPLAENYRLIRSGLLLSSPDHPPRSILVTSMSPKEGKTVTTCNLARILAKNNKNVLIIDCDMRRPRTHNLFKIPNSTGLSNYLSGNTDRDLIKTIPNEPISLITSGPIPPNPAELLQSDRMKTLMREMLKKFDFVLLDSPPLLRVTDSLSISTIVDGILLVARSRQTTYDSLESGLRKLHDIHAPVLGIVLNRLVKSRKQSGYYGYYEYYNKE